MFSFSKSRVNCRFRKEFSNKRARENWSRLRRKTVHSQEVKVQSQKEVSRECLVEQHRTTYLENDRRIPVFVSYLYSDRTRDIIHRHKKKKYNDEIDSQCYHTICLLFGKSEMHQSELHQSEHLLKWFAISMFYHGTSLFCAYSSWPFISYVKQINSMEFKRKTMIDLSRTWFVLRWMNKLLYIDKKKERYLPFEREIY